MYMVCHGQHADTVIVCEQGKLLLNDKRHDSHGDVETVEKL
jgi:hypothetical protein